MNPIMDVLKKIAHDHNLSIIWQKQRTPGDDFYFYYAKFGGDPKEEKEAIWDFFENPISDEVSKDGAFFVWTGKNNINEVEK